MLVAGSDDGAYRITDLDGESSAEKVLDSGRVMRVRELAGVDGVFAATETGLYHSPDAEDWRRLDTPREQVYAVAADPRGNRLYAGTRPAAVYVTEDPPDGGGATDPEWRELEGFQKLPSREEWRLPRHENLAQVRSLRVHPDAPDRLVAGVEVGGVHVGHDGGETWEERRGAVHDDVHQLHVVDSEEFLASTGFGLYRTTDAGRTWHRLDDGVEGRYFRMAYSADGVLYASGAGGPSSNWAGGADAGLFECHDGETLTRVESPCPDEVVVGWTQVDGDVVGATHRGNLLRRRDGEWRWVGSVPVPGEVTGRYVPLCEFRATGISR